MINVFSYRIPTQAMNLFLRFLSVALLCCLFSITHADGQQGTDVPLTNTSIVKLVRAGFKEKTVIAIIHSRTNHFNLGTEQLIELKRSGVSENIILAMLSQDESFSGTGDEWSDDSFFKRNSKKSNGGDPNDSQDSGTGIFGSSGGSKSQSGSRGGNQDETTTTGSATVRILRPPTEAGGAPPKLEKTPVLNNEAIIRLVEAGFSEGTIIKRIEDSPADFDLTPDKLAELHKRRVTDPIISAMSAAMSDKETESKPVAPFEQREN
jgi:hypothetical protein